MEKEIIIKVRIATATSKILIKYKDDLDKSSFFVTFYI